MCVDDIHCEPKITISFSLEGDFLSAAYSDNINLTVDYEQLCNFLISRLNKPEDLTINNLQFLIKTFSPLINNGLINLEVRCAHAYLKDQRIL